MTIIKLYNLPHFTINTTVYEESLTGRPHDTLVQNATSDNENVDAA